MLIKHEVLKEHFRKVEEETTLCEWATLWRSSILPILFKPVSPIPPSWLHKSLSLSLLLSYITPLCHLILPFYSRLQTSDIWASFESSHASNTALLSVHPRKDELTCSNSVFFSLSYKVCLIKWTRTTHQKHGFRSPRTQTNVIKIPTDEQASQNIRHVDRHANKIWLNMKRWHDDWTYTAESDQRSKESWFLWSTNMKP